MRKRFFIRSGKLSFCCTGFPRDLFAATALIAAFWLGFSLPAQAAQQVLKGHVPPITKKLASVGRLEGNSRLDLAIGLPLRNREKLTNLLQEIYQPSSANFRHYLTADEFTSSFGPTEADYKAIADFAKSHGLIVKGTHPNRTLLDVSGSVADIEKAFHVKMQTYQHPTEARTFFAPDVEPSLDLETPVLAISGLDNYVKPRLHTHMLAKPTRPEVRPLGGGGSGGGGGGGGGYAGPFFGSDFRTAYAAGLTQNGAGQSLGLFELAGYYPDDITSFESEVDFVTSVTLTNILIDGFDGNDTNMDYAIEVTSDIEMAISMAPGLDRVLVYEGPTPMDVAPLDTNYIQYSSTTAQINDVLNRMATDNLARQLSCSYEMDINLSTVQIFQQFAAQGQSFFTGSGDLGAYAGAVDEPADDPYITVVGGTTMMMNSNGSAWSSETVWLTPAQNDNILIGLPNSPEYASGGGVSLAYPIPVWQQGISMTANQGSTTMRDLPDVALVANNINVVWGNDAYYETNIYVELNMLLGAGDDYTEGGTSLATPLWAGFMALVNQQAAAKGQPPVGFVNPALYAIGKSTNYHACFHDITTGKNTNASSPSKYSAAAGYDLCTGWGTMIGSNLLPALLAPPSENLVITPPFGFTSSGAGGGPFTVATETYTLTNIGSAPLNWSLVSTSSWLTVSSAAGTLNPHATSSVTVTLNSTASNFIIGNYSGNVSVIDNTDGMTQNRQFDLYVGNGGFETGDFTNWTLVGDTNLSFALSADDVDVGGTNALDGAADALFVHSGIYGAYLGQFPANGSLSQTVATKPGVEYLVSFWLTSVDYQGSTTPNGFAMSWNGSTLYEQTNLDAFGWTNMQFVAPATGKVTTLEFDFNNVPAGFGLDDITVETLPAPAFQSATVASGTITLTWSGIANLSYQVQSASDLSNPQWTNVSGTVSVSGNVVSESAPMTSPTNRFYRVIMLPP